jgi:hypothetical protein
MRSVSGEPKQNDNHLKEGRYHAIGSLHPSCQQPQTTRNLVLIPLVTMRCRAETTGRETFKLSDLSALLLKRGG